MKLKLLDFTSKKPNCIKAMCLVCIRQERINHRTDTGCKNQWLPLVHYKPITCNENKYSLYPKLTGKTCFDHKENLLSLQRSCPHCRQSVFKKGGLMQAPCSTLYRIAVPTLGCLLPIWTRNSWLKVYYWQLCLFSPFLCLSKELSVSVYNWFVLCKRDLYQLSCHIFWMAKNGCKSS